MRERSGPSRGTVLALKTRSWVYSLWSQRLSLPSHRSVRMIGTWMLALAVAATPTCQVKAIDFHGWKAHEISNPWVRLTIVPQLGGRLMQVTFGDHDFLFVNEQLQGQYYPPETSLKERKWY